MSNPEENILDYKKSQVRISIWSKIIKFSIILFVCLIGIYFLYPYIPKNVIVSGTNINISGFLILATIITILIISIKSIYKLNCFFTIYTLSGSGTIIVLIAEIACQIFYQFHMINTTTIERIIMLLRSTLITGFIALGISFMISHYLKKKNGKILSVMIIAFMLLVAFIGKKYIL